MAFAAFGATTIYDLTTLQSVKSYMRMTDGSYDLSLIGLITAASDRIEQITGRKFAAREYTERYDGVYAQEILNLPQFPVLSVTRIAYGNAGALTVSYSGSGIRAVAQVTTTGVILSSWNTSGVKTDTSFLFATYGSTFALATAISAVTGWTAQTIINIPSSDLVPTAAVNVTTSPFTFGYPDRDVQEYNVDTKNGVISGTSGSQLYHVNGYGFGSNDISPATFGQGQNYLSTISNFPRGFQNIMVQYRAGYETIPGDIQQVCNELVQQIFNAGAVDKNLKSEKLDQYAYTLASNAELNEGQYAILERWRKVAVG